MYLLILLLLHQTESKQIKSVMGKFGVYTHESNIKHVLLFKISVLLNRSGDIASIGGQSMDKCMFRWIETSVSIDRNVVK